MSDFRTVSTSPGRIDPGKRVKYSMGLVLGVDEFEQEQTYFLERGRLHSRMLHGYGTVCGLQVTADGTKVTVAPGLAISPQGQEIRVSPAQCADLAEWMAVAENLAAVELDEQGRGAVFVTLCYRECETDQVPVPGAPCRTEEESLVPSRVTESFELRFAAEPPEQPEEEVARRFGELLGRVRLSEIHAPGAGDGEDPWAYVEEEVRSLLTPPDGEAPGPIYIRPDGLEEALRRIFRVWVTEVRPALLADKGGCSGGAPDEACVALARVRFRLVEGGVTEVAVDEEGRPCLLPTRLLQEYLLRHAPMVDAGGDLTGTYPNPRVIRLQGRPVAPNVPKSGEVLQWDGSRWVPQPIDTSGGGGVELAQVAAELPVSPFVTIWRVPDRPEAEGPIFRMWFHLNVGEPEMANRPTLVPEFKLLALGETVDDPFVRELAVLEIKPVLRNLFDVTIIDDAYEYHFIRFLFPLKEMHLEEGMSLFEWVQERPLKWLGHDGEGIVTAFHLNDLGPWGQKLAAGPQVVASGVVSYEGTVAAGNIRVARQTTPGVWLVGFPGYDPGARYLVKGTVIDPGTDAPPALFSVIDTGRPHQAGILVRVVTLQGDWAKSGFSVEVTRLA